MALVQQLQPSQTFQDYIESSDGIIQSSSIFCKGSKHVSSKENQNFRSLGEFTEIDLPSDHLQKLQRMVDRKCTLPPLISFPKSIYHEADATTLYVIEIAQRAQVLFSVAFSDFRLEFPQEWTYFNGKKADASLDFLWRVEKHGCYHTLCFTEFKQPGSIDLDEWRRAIGFTGELQGTSEEQSQQLSKYFSLRETDRCQFSDITSTVSIFLDESPKNLDMENPLNAFRVGPASCEVWMTENATSLGGDSLLTSTLAFLYECLRKDG